MAFRLLIPGFFRLSTLVLVASLAFACGESAPPEPSRSAASGPATPKALNAPEERETGEDAALTARVKEALAGESAEHAEIEVRSNAGVVLLKGRVESDEDKKRIMAAAQNVPGVKWVQNQVAVTPPPSPASSRGK